MPGGWEPFAPGCSPCNLCAELGPPRGAAGFPKMVAGIAADGGKWLFMRAAGTRIPDGQRKGAGPRAATPAAHRQERDCPATGSSGPRRRASLQTGVQVWKPPCLPHCPHGSQGHGRHRSSRGRYLRGCRAYRPCWSRARPALSIRQRKALRHGDDRSRLRPGPFAPRGAKEP